METIEAYYLIDFENVNRDGLEGCDKLVSADHIVIFFTQNANKIAMSDIADHGDAEITMYEVPAGRQSADIHISSYLGYIVGKHEVNKCNIAIVSKDKDFDNVIKFWKDKAGINIIRKQQISKKKEDSPSKGSTKVSGIKNTKLNREVIQAVRTAGYDTSVANTVAQISTELYGSKTFLLDVHNALKKRYSDGVDVYDVAKPVLSKYADATPEKKKTTTKTITPKDKTAKNAEVMKILSNAGYPNEVVTYVASTVVKNLGIKNGKQQNYRIIISKYGQGKGLAIYNHIKKHI